MHLELPVIIFFLLASFVFFSEAGASPSASALCWLEGKLQAPSPPWRLSSSVLELPCEV